MLKQYEHSSDSRPKASANADQTKMAYVVMQHFLKCLKTEVTHDCVRNWYNMMISLKVPADGILKVKPDVYSDDQRQAIQGSPGRSKGAQGMSPAC